MTESPPDRTELEALWGEVAERSSGYLQRELPHPLDGVLRTVVERFSDGDEATRVAILETMTLEAARASAVYEERLSDNGLLYARSGPMMSREEVEELQHRLEG